MAKEMIGGMIDKEKFRSIIAKAFHEEEDPAYSTERYCHGGDHIHDDNNRPDCEALADDAWHQIQEVFEG